MLICAPVKKWPTSTANSADLYEFKKGSSKFLYDASKNLRFIDIDWQEASPGKRDRLIVSYHNFQETPDLQAVFLAMKARHPSACYYKIATFACSTLDSLRMIHFQRQHPEVIGVCMGEHGTLTRILAPITGCPLVYAPLTKEDQNAEGQLLWSELSTIYHFRHLNRKTRIYGLIGHPVRQSIGHLFHNDQFRQHHFNGVYVKMSLIPEELAPFFELIETLPIFGLSVTAPLKEQVISHLCTLSQESRASGAVNTLCRTSRGWEGSNSDGKAVVAVLGNVKGKKVVILGAGGAARAIAYELIRKKAVVTLVNRTAQKGIQVAKELGCQFSEGVPPYDILVNATSSPQLQNLLKTFPKATVMDIAICTTPFLREAKAQGCHVLNGLPMYFLQAIKQQVFFRQH